MRSPYVVVGVDGSKDGLIALDWAVAAAARRRWPVRVVNVVDDETPGELAPAMVRLLVPDDGSEVIEDAAAELSRLGTDAARMEIRRGYPADVLLAMGRDGGLLVIGRRGRDGFAELATGSVSQVCAALAEVPVVVVPDQWSPDAPPHGRVVIGLDGTAGSVAALEFAAQEATNTAAALLAVRAVKLPETYPAEDFWLDPEAAGWSPQVDHEPDEQLAPIRERFTELKIETCVAAGHPVQVLAKESAAADLLVVGGAGRKVFTGLRMGSVSRGLVDHTACPLAIIHDGLRP